MTDRDKMILRRAALLMASIVTVVVAGLVYYANFTFHSTGIDPKKTEISAYTPLINFNFSQDIKPQGVVATMQPNMIGSAVVNGSKITINLEPLTAGQKYTITIKNIESTAGKKIGDQTYTFTANNRSFDDLPNSQKRAAMAQQNAPTSQNTQDKAFDYIPHGGLNYNLTVVQTNGKIIINAELLLSAADVRIDRNAAIETYKQEVLDYLNESGLDVNKYTINYTVTETT